MMSDGCKYIVISDYSSHISVVRTSSYLTGGENIVISLYVVRTSSYPYRGISDRILRESGKPVINSSHTSTTEMPHWTSLGLHKIKWPVF